MSFVFDVTSDSFERDVIQASFRQPVLVDFWAPWCGPCRTLTPILEKCVAAQAGKVVLAKVDSDRNPRLAAQYGVRGIPNVKAFVDGRIVDEFTGALPEREVAAFLAKLIPSPAESVYREALALKARGDLTRARALFGEAVELDPTHAAARLDLAELLLDLGELDDARRVLDEVAATLDLADRLQAIKARLSLLVERVQGESAEALHARIAADPGDLQARLQLARRAAADRQWGEAFGQLLEIVARDRAFGDDIGRKTMLELFNMLPPHDPLVREYRMKLASLLSP
jgi:putative thioredoxin